MALQSPAPLLKQLSTSLDGLIETLDPLLTQPLAQLSARLESGSSSRNAEPAQPTGKGADKDESSAIGKDGPATIKDQEKGIELAGKLDAARLHASIAYVLLDLVWIYLKTKGVDPATHPVMPELERVKGYFHKIKHAQDSESREARSNLDQSAAARFIRHAIGGSGHSSSSSSFAASAAAQSPQGQHKRFDFEKDDNDEDGEGQGESDSSDGNQAGGSAGKKRNSKEIGKGKRSAAESAAELAVTVKGPSGKRVQLDPFTGYLDPADSSATTTPPRSAMITTSNPASTSASQPALSQSQSQPGTPANGVAATEGTGGKKQRKKEKKKRGGKP
ncbi:hypothetical protein K437DRAFT_98670 [Tilletiaria anomala UBC 951]|uniref:Exosome complex protein n=1 Tax=Tilletiaria anomala (strain ATCC 24038 / CBS 436.72 / UBC 951) TaxID=1037660 RepID=A0A066WHP8_TILAU|nr:uncharacterized protein K437DRAFT_98670 [Tilletiaria anomala UBC 951]KDN53321.1 hypothetical protein K437DRAFT_98670 [Tilletiaria anomala UBC 951]